MQIETISVNDTEAIWKKYYSKLLHFVNKRVNDASKADDLVQEIMIKIYGNIGTLKSEEKIQSWIYQIARNTIIDYFRTQKPEVGLPQMLTAPQRDEHAKAREEISTCLEPMINNLPTAYREAVTLSEMQGLTQKEVAHRQGLSLSGAKSRVQRGRGLLKEMLLECCTFELDHKKRIIDYQRKQEKCNCE